MYEYSILDRGESKSTIAQAVDLLIVVPMEIRYTSRKFNVRMLIASPSAGESKEAVRLAMDSEVEE